MHNNYNGNTSRTTTTTTTPTSSSSSTIARTRAREAELNVMIADLKDLYYRAIGQPMSAICADSLRRDLESGQTTYMQYHYALTETAYAPRPSWRYALAIVRRLELQGITDDDLRLTISLKE